MPPFGNIHIWCLSYYVMNIQQFSNDEAQLIAFSEKETICNDLLINDAIISNSPVFLITLEF